MIPALNIDPVCQAFFDDPLPAHAAMRDAGAVVYLPAYDIYAGRTLRGRARDAG